MYTGGGWLEWPGHYSSHSNARSVVVWPLQSVCAVLPCTDHERKSYKQAQVVTKAELVSTQNALKAMYVNHTDVVFYLTV